MCERERISFTPPVLPMGETSWQWNVCELREDVKVMVVSEVSSFDVQKVKAWLGSESKEDEMEWK